jgi:hypothetical protein
LLVFAGVCWCLLDAFTGAAGHMQQTQERHDAEVLGRWKTEECLPVCLLPQAWWADWWAQAAKSQGKLRRLRLLCKGTAPPPITACEWLNRYATPKQKFLAPWKLCNAAGLPEMVLKLTLQCRCSGIFPLSHPSLLVLTLLVCWCLLVFAGVCCSGICTMCNRNVTKFRPHAKSADFQLAKAAGTGAAYLEIRNFTGYQCRPCL